MFKLVTKNMGTINTKIMTFEESPNFKRNKIYKDFDILKEIAGMGRNNNEIHVCVRHGLKESPRFALKVLTYRNEQEKQAAKNECELHCRASKDANPHIVRVEAVYKHDINFFKNYFLVLECMDGGKLWEGIKNKRIKLTEHNVAKMIAQIVSAVEHIHTLDIAHRNICFSNLLLTNDTEPRIKLTDFGDARDMRKQESYVENKKHHEILVAYEFSNDILPIGAIMHYLLSGRSPINFRETSVSNLFDYNEFDDFEWTGISEHAKELVKGMLEPDHYKRLNINEIKNSKWITKFSDHPKTPLTASVNIDQMNWEEVNEEIKEANDHLRIDRSMFNIKPLSQIDSSENKLLERRKLKKAAEIQLSRQNSKSNKNAVIFVE